MTPDPVFGVLTRERFQELVAAPFGEATKAIRAHDPMWARPPGTKLKWEVTFERDAVEIGSAVVEAETRDDAEDVASDLDDRDISWGNDFEVCGPVRVESVDLLTK